MPQSCSDSEVSEFLLRACHDLRGPVRTMRIHSELLAKGEAPSQDAEQSLAFVLKGASTAAALVDGITDYALALIIDPARFQPVPMDIMLRSALAKLAKPIRETEAQITYGDLPTVPGDADRILQLLEYLVDYTLRRCGAGKPVVRLDAELHEDEWLFTLRDNCAGLNTDEVERVFKPFARVNGNERPGPGLTICRTIVERHGGRMWAESEEASGVIRFTLLE
jgi:light-regulated signal transduction histidine kinase (bacteriophytochrome)